MIINVLINILILGLILGLFATIIPLVILGIVTFFEIRRGFLMTDHREYFPKDHKVRGKVQYILYHLQMQKRVYGIWMMATLLISLYLFFIEKSWFYLYFYIIISALMLFDARYYLLPDPLNYLLLWSGIVVALLGVGSVSLEASIVAVIVTYLLLFTLSMSYRCVGIKDALGNGDLKLSAALAAWFGIESMVTLLLLATLLAMLYLFGRWIYNGYRERKIPFGPFLGVSGIIHYGVLLYK